MFKARFVIILSLFVLAVPAATLNAAKLDIEGRDLTGQDVKLYGGLVDYGVLISKSTGNALAAGIKDGDVVVSINGRRVNGIFDLEEILQTIRGMRFKVEVRRVTRHGLVRAENYIYEIESAIDLQIRKAFTLNLGVESPVTTGKYRDQSLLLWYANGVWVYDKKIEREHIVSLLKVYSISEHKTYRYTVPEKVLHAQFLNSQGLILYVSTTKDHGIIGVVDIETGTRKVEWQFEVESLQGKSFDIKTRDINGDEIPEIFFSIDSKVTCLDGVQGMVIWYRGDLRPYFLANRNREDEDYPVIYVDDFTRDGAYEVCAGTLLLNAATGSGKIDPSTGQTAFLSFDPLREKGGILECRDLIGDAMPDMITKDGLYDGNSGESAWQPLRSEEYFLADLNGNGKFEIAYLLQDKKIHVHGIKKHREFYSIAIEGSSDLSMQDFNRDGFADLMVRRQDVVYLYQTNIPLENIRYEDRGIGYAASLLDYGLRKDKFYVFAKELFDKGQFKESVPLFLRALSDNPDREETLKYLASAFIKAGDLEGALALMHKRGPLVRNVLHQFSAEIVAYLLDSNKTWQAIDFLEMRKDEDPLLLARCYLAVGRPEVAIKILTEMESKPTDAQLLLGRAYALMNKMVAARVAYNHYLKFYPRSATGWYELGELEAHEENWDTAEEMFEVCADLDQVLGNIALSAFYLKDSPKRDLRLGLKYARTGHRLEPSNRTKIQLAEALVENENFRDGSRLLSQVSEPGAEFNRYEKLMQRCLYQNQAESKYEEAEKLLLSPVFKKRNFVKAKGILTEIIDRYPKSLVFSLAHFRLGEIYLDAEHRDEDKALYHFGEVEKAKHYLSSRASQKKLRLNQQSLTKNQGQELNVKIEEIEKPKTVVEEEEIIAPTVVPELVPEKVDGFPVQKKSREVKKIKRRRGFLEKLKSVPFSILKLRNDDHVQEVELKPVDKSNKGDQKGESSDSVSQPSSTEE